MSAFSELFRNILIILLLMALLSWLLSLVRVTFAIRTIQGKKEEIFNKLLAILENQEIKVKQADPLKGRVVTEVLVNVIDIVLYRLIGNRVVFQLRELMNQEIELRVYAYASFLFIRLGLRKSERAKVIDEGKVNIVLDELVSS